MDKIWDRKSEVIGFCGRDEKTNDTQNSLKSNTKFFKNHCDHSIGCYFNLVT